MLLRARDRALTTKEETAILEAAFDQQQYASHIIVDQYLLDQACYLPVATPDPDFIHIESSGILPFDPTDLPKEFTQSLLPQTKGVITTYEIIVYEDRKTRERKIR